MKAKCRICGRHVVSRKGITCKWCQKKASDEAKKTAEDNTKATMAALRSFDRDLRRMASRYRSPRVRPLPRLSDLHI